jgi:hypothetical protein
MLLKVAFLSLSLYIYEKLNEIKQTLVWIREVKKRSIGCLDSCTTTWNKFIQK